MTAAGTHATVLGATGFIGRGLASHLRTQGLNVDAPPRTASSELLAHLRARELGDAFYCIGLTADFRSRPFDTIDAHVGLLRHILDECSFRSLTYLSSTRVYINSQNTGETATLGVKPLEPDDLYGISKLMGESLCLSSGRNCRVARLSNVFGPGDESQNFLSSILREAATAKRVVFRSSPRSSKDYVDLDDVVVWLAKLAAGGKHPIYNLASGRNTPNADIAKSLETCGIATAFEADAPTVAFPEIDTARVCNEFGPPRAALIDRLPQLLAQYKA